MDAKTREALQAVTAILTDLLNEPAKAPQSKTETKAPTTSTKKRCLTRENRKAFAADAPWAAHLSCRQIADAIVNGDRKAPKGWKIGAGYKALVK